MRILAALAWALALAAITLRPGPASYARIVSFCVLCGDRATADAILNMVLFIPLGLLVGVRRGPIIGAAAGLALSAGVEAGQLLLPGRYSNVGDIVWNATGAGLGAALVPLLRQALHGTSVRGRALAVSLPVVWLALAGTALSTWHGGGPGVPLASFDAPRTSGVGHVLSAQADGEALEGGAAPIRVATARDPDQLSARVRLRDGTRRLVALVNVDDGLPTPRMSLALHGDDLVWWERKRARVLGFDLARPHLGGVTGAAHGAEWVHLGVRRSGDDICLRVEEVERCGLGVAPERSWTLLRSREHASAAFKLGVDVAWAATLTFLLGLVGGGPRSSGALVVVFGGSVAALSAATPLTAPGTTGLLGLIVGVSFGILLRPLAARFLEHPDASAHGRAADARSPAARSRISAP